MVFGPGIMFLNFHFSWPLSWPLISVGQAVSVDEQVDMKASTASLQEEEKPSAPAPALTASVSSAVDEGTKAQFEEEKMKLYEQLDDKVSDGW